MESIILPEAFAIFSVVLAVIVTILAIIALVYAIVILHNVYKISRFAKDTTRVLKDDLIGVLQKIFTNDNIKTAVAALVSWGTETFKTIKKRKKTVKKTTRKKTTASKSNKSNK